jgi:hypothetical protein
MPWNRTDAGAVATKSGLSTRSTVPDKAWIQA